MRKPRSRYPVSSFDPRFIETLMRAAKGETIKIDFPDIKAARAFQNRIQMLRSQMKREEDDRYSILTRATTSLRNADGSKFVRGQSDAGRRQLWIMPRDIEFDDVFNSIGVEKPPELSETVGHDILDDLPDGPVPIKNGDVEK